MSFKRLQTMQKKLRGNSTPDLRKVGQRARTTWELLGKKAKESRSNSRSTPVHTMGLTFCPSREEPLQVPEFLHPYKRRLP
jgi:hypothetical protein